MDATLITLKSHLQSYRKLDEDLKELNSKSLEVRRERKQIENEMSIILQKPEFQQYDKLEIKEDGSLIRIQRPGMWTKGWSMSKHELIDGLEAYFSKYHDNPNPEDCYEFMVERQKPKMVSNEFAFERTIQTNPAKRNKYSM
jgi:hypothetical protein